MAKCCDHLGNRFSSKLEMCKYYGVNTSTFRDRIYSGYKLEDALTVKTQRRGKVKDHLGNEFDNIDELVKYYNITRDAYSDRISKGNMTLEEVLLTPVHQKNIRCNDHLGNKYDTITQMCKNYNVKISTFQNRIKEGWSLEEALTGKDRSTYDHLGNKFKSRTDMCVHYGVKVNIFNSRISSVWLKEEALGIKGRGLDASIKNKEVININIVNIELAYKGRNGKLYYLCNDKNTGEELLLNADEILVYKQKDYKTAVKQLLIRRRGALNG